MLLIGNPRIGIPRSDVDHLAQKWTRLYLWKEIDSQGLDAAHIAFARFLLNQGKFSGDTEPEEGRMTA